MNSSMRAIFEVAAIEASDQPLPAELDAVASAGFVVNDGRLFLAAPEHTSIPPKGMDDWEAERWVNKVHLDTDTPPTDDAWRPELLRLGLELARRLLPKATALTALPVQAMVSLQSSADDVDPEIDFATGSVHVYSIRSAKDDDLALGIERFAQPCLTVTDQRTG